MRRELVPIYGPDGEVVRATWKLTIGGGQPGTWSGQQMWMSTLATSGYLLAQTQNIKDPFTQHDWFRAILDRKADALAAVPPIFKRGARNDGEPDQVDYTYDKWADLFDQPNPDCSWRGFISSHIYFKRLYGLSLWLSLRDGNPCPIEETNELRFLNPIAFEPVRNTITRMIDVWRPRPGVNAPPYPAESVHAFRVPGPYGDDTLCPPWKAAELAMNVDYVFEQANLEFGRKGFSLGGWVIGEDWDKNQVEDTRKILKDRYSGPTHQGEYGVLGGSKVTIVPNQMNHKNMEYIEGGRFNLEKLLAIEGIPLSWVSKGDALNNSTLTGEDSGAWLRTIDPELCEIETYWWRNCFSRIDSGRRWLEFDRDAVPAFQAARLGPKLDNAKKLIDLGYPINLVSRRLSLGMPRVEWGDEAYANGAMLPLSFIEGSEKRLAEKTAFLAAKTEKAIVTEATGTVDNPTSGTAAGDGSATAADNASANNPPRALVDRSLEGFREKNWNDWVRAVLDPNEVAFKRMMVGYFDAQRRDVLERFDKVTGGGRKAARAAKDQQSARALTQDEINQILFDLEEWNRKLIEKANPIYRNVVASTTQDLANELDGLKVWSESNPAVTSLLASRGAALVGVNDTTIEALQAALVAGSEANETVLELAARINQVFNEGSRARSLTIARTETAGTANEVRFQAMKAEGIESHYWHTAGDESVRAAHAAMEGETVKVGDPFSNGLVKPGDLDGPPEQCVNCRCVAVPIVGKP